MSKKVVKNGDKLTVTGDLTMHGVTKEIPLNVEVLGFASGHAGFQATGNSRARPPMMRTHAQTEG